jgi:hypothetical protein
VNSACALDYYALELDAENQTIVNRQATRLRPLRLILAATRYDSGMATTKPASAASAGLSSGSRRAPAPSTMP